MSFLGDLTPERFLQVYWQKKPLYVPRAVPHLVSSSEPACSLPALRQLAQDEGVESRLVQQQGESWNLRLGPFADADWTSLPARDWTLLVQDLDVHAPDIAAYLSKLDFLPSYRIDDVMASYAVPGGSVGPHFDQYDVFLLQVSGHKRWQWTTRFDRTKLRDDTDLCILSEFEAEGEQLLGPGDLLYLPPHVAHHGVALDAGVTCSLGCRAPSAEELLTQVVHNALEASDESLRYADPDLSLVEAGDELSAAALLRARTAIESALDTSDRALLLALGQVLSRPKALFEDTFEQSSPLTKPATALRRARGSRWVVHVDEHRCLLFVNGNVYAPALEDAEWARVLCRATQFDANDVERWCSAPTRRNILQALLSEGVLQTESAFRSD